MLRKNPLIVFGLFVIAHLILVWKVSSGLYFGGDEWYTWDNFGFPLMALPNQLLNLLLELILGEMSAANFMFHRFGGSLWILTLLLSLFYLWRKEDQPEKKRFLLLSMGFILISPMVVYYEQFYRFYGMYLFFSWLLFWFIWNTHEQYTKYRWWYFLIGVISPFVMFFFAWVMVFTVIWMELAHSRSQREKWIKWAALILGTILLVFLWKPIMGYVMGHTPDEVLLGERGFRGFYLGSLVKPFYFFSEYILGIFNEITDAIWLAVLTVLLLFILAMALFKRWKDPLVAIFLMSYLGMILIIEPLTLPGSTQMSANRLLFLLPALIYAIAHWRVSIRWVSWIFIPIAIYTNSNGNLGPQPDLRKAAEISRGEIFTDGRAFRSFNLYVEEPSTPLHEWKGVRSDTITLVLNDYKSYQVLTADQMWNTGTSSEERYDLLQGVFADLAQYDWRLMRSYIHFPVQSWVLVKDSMSEAYPSFLGMPYRDLHFPRMIEGEVFLGLQDITGSIEFEEPLFDLYYFIENGGRGCKIRLEYEDGTTGIIQCQPISDTYGNLYSNGAFEDEVVDRWTKRSLVSTSIRYPGSFLPSEGMIFKHHSSKGITGLHLLKEDVILHRLLPR